MASKANPIGIRIPINQYWESVWFTGHKNFSTFLAQDLKIRNYIHKTIKEAGITNIIIYREENKIIINIHTAKPGIVIGKSGKQIEDLKNNISKIFSVNCSINVEEVKEAELESAYIAESIAISISRRVNFRRAIKEAISRSISSGAKGIKVEVSGRLNGVDIARAEKFIEGSVPLQTLRADISYSSKSADTTYGKIGIKVWIYRGEKMSNNKSST